MLTLLFLMVTALGGDWARQEIEPRVLTDVTAYTPQKKHLILGVFRQQYGLLDNAAIGTRLPYFALGIVNAHAKVTAIQTPKLDASLSAEWLYRDLADLGIPGGTARVTPLSWKASWILSRRMSLHFGTTWMMASVSGELSTAELGDALGAVVGADIGEELRAVAGDGTSLYAGGNLTLFQTNLAVEYRFNRRDSLILTSNASVWASGLLAGGARLDEGDVELEVGPSVRFRMPLSESLPTLMALSWQFSWERVHLRLGVPIPVTGPGAPFALPQALALYWDLGPSSDAPDSVREEPIPSTLP